MGNENAICEPIGMSAAWNSEYRIKWTSTHRTDLHVVHWWLEEESYWATNWYPIRILWTGYIPVTVVMETHSDLHFLLLDFQNKFAIHSNGNPNADVEREWQLLLLCSIFSIHSTSSHMLEASFDLQKKLLMRLTVCVYLAGCYRIPFFGTHRRYVEDSETYFSSVWRYSCSAALVLVSEVESYKEAAQTLLTIGHMAHHSQSEQNQTTAEDQQTGERKKRCEIHYIGFDFHLFQIKLQ